jgi:hypothetical protein
VGTALSIRLRQAGPTAREGHTGDGMNLSELPHGVRVGTPSSAYLLPHL